MNAGQIFNSLKTTGRLALGLAKANPGKALAIMGAGSLLGVGAVRSFKGRKPLTQREKNDQNATMMGAIFD